jgi:hypothetical protein
MATFQFDLVSPEKLAFSGEVDQVDVPGVEGDSGVLAGHAPVVVLLEYWLEVSPEEQTKRLTARIDDKRKIWKLSQMDLDFASPSIPVSAGIRAAKPNANAKSLDAISPSPNPGGPSRSTAPPAIR